MPDVEIVWFSEKRTLLAHRYGNTYAIINGAWDWSAEEYPDIPIDDWKKFTREEFDAYFPDFGY